jgi:hypothetical protein
MYFHRPQVGAQSNHWICVKPIPSCRACWFMCRTAVSHIPKFGFRDHSCHLIATVNTKKAEKQKDHVDCSDPSDSYVRDASYHSRKSSSSIAEDTVTRTRDPHLWRWSHLLKEMPLLPREIRYLLWEMRVHLWISGYATLLDFWRLLYEKNRKTSIWTDFLLRNGSNVSQTFFSNTKRLRAAGCFKRTFEISD